MAAANGIERTAEFDATGCYRYRLDRQWHPTRPAIACIMLNPSRADADGDDPTLRRCTRLAQSWLYGHLMVVNLFAYCTSQPTQLRQVPDPVGAANDAFIDQVCKTAAHIWLAWGNWGSLYGRDQIVLRRLTPYRDRLYCVGINSTGQPQHPLYVPRTAQLHLWDNVRSMQWENNTRNDSAPENPS